MANENPPDNPQQAGSYPSPFARPADNPWQPPPAPQAPHPSQPEPTMPYPVPGVDPYAQQYPATPPPPPSAPSGPGGWRADANPVAALFDFSFTTFATPGLVKVVYLLQVVAAVGTWLIWILGAFTADRFAGGGFGAGILALLFGWIPVLLSIAFTRFVLEGIVALIRIHDRVTEIADRGKDAPSV